MIDDTTQLHSDLREDRRTVPQLLAAAVKDSDAVSVFMDGTSRDDSLMAIFVVKGRQNIDYLHQLCVRQGLVTDKPVEGPACNLERPWEAPQ